LANDRQIASVQKAWRSVGRIGSVETLIGIVRTRSGLWFPSVAQDWCLWQGPNRPHVAGSFKTRCREPP
jgi:hypothetical protein